MAKRESEKLSDVAIICGGGGGLGRAVSRRFAKSGARVVVVDIGDAAEKVATELRNEGFSPHATICDLTDGTAVEALREEVMERYGQVEALVNLAGQVRNDKLVDVTDADFDLTITSHAKSTLNTMRTFAPIMKKANYGRIVNTSSVAALGSIAGTSYCAAKGAIEAMTRTAAMELARYGITVNCIAPGIVDTGMFRQQPERAREHMVSRTPMRRGGDPSEHAAGFYFLASREASFITGQTLYICGGASIGAFV